VTVVQLPFAKPDFDVNRRYVRFRELRPDGFVEFDFAIGDPELSVELVMLLKDYQAFCLKNNVTYLTREQGKALDSEQSKWRFGAPGIEE
jgi:phenol/toluene 2-monooxygenase (NADH) P0/A0